MISRINQPFRTTQEGRKGNEKERRVNFWQRAIIVDNISNNVK